MVKKGKEILYDFVLPLSDAIDLKRSRHVDVQDIKTVCLLLGPYRNLTTLTASTLFLHPNCQVLNHAGQRVFGNKEIDFLFDDRQERLDRFLQFAVCLSEKGTRGRHGGSITHSHAFSEYHDMKAVFDKAKLPLVKNTIQCLVWKESLRTANTIRERRIDMRRLLEQEGRLRFLMPVRNPLDCAASNLKTGHAKLFRGSCRSFFDVLDAILNEIVWFVELEQKYPDRFFHFYEYDITKETLMALAAFLCLDRREDWLSRALTATIIKSGYHHDEDKVRFYSNCIEDKVQQNPALLEGLQRFIE